MRSQARPKELNTPTKALHVHYIQRRVAQTVTFLCVQVPRLHGLDWGQLIRRQDDLRGQYHHCSQGRKAKKRRLRAGRDRTEMIPKNNVSYGWCPRTVARARSIRRPQGLQRLNVSLVCQNFRSRSEPPRVRIQVRHDFENYSTPTGPNWKQ